MIIHPRNDSFARDFNAKYEQDTDIYCSICGDSIFRWYDMERNSGGEICCHKCILEHMEEEQNEI